MAFHQSVCLAGSSEEKAAALTMMDPSENWALWVVRLGFIAVAPQNLRRV